MFHSCVDAVIESLSYQEDAFDWNDCRRYLIHDYQDDLRFIKMFLWGSVLWDPDADLRSLCSSIESTWEHVRANEYQGLEKVAEMVPQSKRRIMKHCQRFESKSLKCKPLTSHEIQKFIDLIVVNMERLLSCRADGILPLKNQIEIIEKKLLIFRNLVEFTAVESLHCKTVKDFNTHVLTWANEASCLALLFWKRVPDADDEDFFPEGDTEDEDSSDVDVEDEDSSEEDVEFENRMNHLVTDLLHKYNPRTPEFVEMCFEVIKLTKSLSLDIFIFEEFVSHFVDFLLQNLILTPGDGFVILKEGLVYLITFLAGSPENAEEDSELMYIESQIDAVLTQASRLICLFGFSDGKTMLTDLMNHIDKVRGRIDKLGVQLPLSTWSNFPRTDGLGFVKNLVVRLEDLEEAMSQNSKLPPSLKHQIFTITDELASLRPFLQDIAELQNDHKELKDLWEEIIRIAYQAELAIHKSIFSNLPFCFSYVLRKIQYIQSKVIRVKDSQIYKTGVIYSLTSSANMLKVSVPTLAVDEVVVGFNQEAEGLIDQLTRGTNALDIVSIVGMGGIGKTTLAKKLYNEASVRYCFHKRAFCTVSQVYRRKNILLDFLSQLTGENVNDRDMMEDDLDLKLYKSLKGYRYLIVLDDIWDMNVWIDVKNSFPDDHNRSRVMFTTRIYDLALLAKPNCNPHRLRFLSLDESWDLLQQKIFHKNPCPSHLCDVGISIAKNCKGLPLAIVVIAGLLAKSERSLSWWQKISDNLALYVSSEGCNDVLELSCKHLPEALKSCFLYLGAFPEDTDYRAGDITKLWSAEGFVPKSEESCMHKIAKEYLNYLADRSLLIVTERSSTGRIKSFRVHDTIRDFCISKAQEEHFLCVLNGHNDNFSMPLRYDQYRICIESGWRSFVAASPRGPTVHTLLFFNNGDTICTDDHLIRSLLRNFKLIQVLDLRLTRISQIPAEILMLVHLRYLAIICGPCFGGLPEIANLRNLETLYIHAGYVDIDLGDAIWKMKMLRHLEIPCGCFLALGDDADEAFSQLLDLETVGMVRIRDRKEGEVLLRRLPNVRKLGLVCHALPEQLVDFVNLESLCIKDIYEVPRVQKSLSLPLTLRKLTLKGFLLPCKELATMVGELPCLQVLKLIECTFDDNRWDVEDDEFPGLKYLKLENTGIEYWNATIDSFPCLEKLFVRHCYHLVEIPPCFGQVATLRALEIRSCSEGADTSAVQIQEEQLDMGNESLEFLIVTQLGKRVSSSFTQG